MISERKAANTLSGKTARTCESCSRRRARWFCAADDAFLCQSCDDLVHSANLLASRHERARLEMAPAWHQGFNRKARMPRNNTNKSTLLHQELKDEEKAAMDNPVPLVPEIGSEESFGEEDEDQLLYRVPVCDPFAAELEKCDDLDNLAGCLTSDMDLSQFAADLLGIDEDCTYMNKLGLFDFKEEEGEDKGKLCLDGAEKEVRVKDELEMEAITDCHLDQAFDIERVSMDWNFNYESSIEEQEEKSVAVADNGMMNKEEEKKEMGRSSSLLRLNYDAVITAWSSQGSPWTTGSRPQLHLDDSWPDFMGGRSKEDHHTYRGLTRGDNEVRVARVLRYKQKRSTRLFSKKIRYEVRKLNAEKRPRMKGRFVKRTSSIPSAFPYINK